MGIVSSAEHGYHNGREGERVNRISAVVTLFLLVAASPSGAEDRMIRAGLTFLGTGFLSATVEYGTDDAALRVRLGMFEPGEICATVSAHRFMGSGVFRPQAGIGLSNVLIFPDGKFGRLTFLTVPVGIEHRFREQHTLGLEGDLNCFLSGRSPGGGPVSWKKRERGFRRRLLPLPAAYYLFQAK